ncbi:MAG: MATE family efflux transporter, partial [Lachnospira sp.]|nr:MATE family efflux transporter [Lachnospira sp.]
IVSISFIFAGTNVAFQGIYQALDGGIQSLVISVLRQLVLVVPLAFIFVRIAVANPDMTALIWWAFLSQSVCPALLVYFYIRELRNVK